MNFNEKLSPKQYKRERAIERANKSKQMRKKQIIKALKPRDRIMTQNEIKVPHRNDSNTIQLTRV